MPLNDKQKKQLIALTRKLKEQKGISIKPQEINSDIAKFKQAQEDITKIRDQHPDSPAVQEEADKEMKKLQTIINDLNEYMQVLHPEGLLDFGSGAQGQQIVGQG